MTADLNDFKSLLAIVARGEQLDESQAELAFETMMSGNATPAQMGGFLMALRVRGETVAEITGAVRAMRSKMTRIEAPPGAIDTCGTGGDGAGTWNISTAAALVVAACGVPVAKHGNRAASSKTGTADVLAALGVDIDADMALVKQALWQVKIGFMMAPRHHSAMRHVGPTRVELGTRTIFNLMGPLSNPAGARRQLIGVFARDWLGPMAMVLSQLGTERAWLVHGSDGLDELTTTGISHVAELRDGKVTSFEIDPQEAGLPRADPAALKGADAETNAAALVRLLEGERSAYRDIVLLNSAAALVIADRVRDLKDGAAMATAAIDSGEAKATLARLAAITNGQVTA
ncbi:anthranilate phosphoribosyltransferase [Rhodospirillaceae bacterium SYSU D60014]|uniref:anthranilate phosphoribosyltransferase n=1 Tax=Virgifigura deserti TaxID=2268457 RepID=UPI000E661BE8